MASATGSHPDTGSSVRPLPGSSTTIRPAPGRRFNALKLALLTERGFAGGRHSPITSTQGVFMKWHPQ
jgi:hypothetical protein